MRRLIIISAITCMLSAASCHKDPGPFTVSGVVLDHTTNKPVDSATVYLLAHEKDGGIWGGSPSFFIDTTIADANGKFFFAPEKNDDWGYSCMAEKDLYFLGDEYTADGSYALTVNVYIYPKAWLRIHFKNILPSDPADQFAINGSVTDYFLGDDIDTLIIYSVIGNGDKILHYGLYTDIENIDATIYCPAFDTTYFEILY